MNKCQQCNEEFEVEESTADEKNRFCDLECEDAYLDEVEEELEN